MTPVADEPVGCYRNLMKEVDHARFPVLEGALIWVTILAVFTAVFYFPTLDTWSILARALATMASIILIAMTLLVVLVYLRHQRLEERERVEELPTLRQSEISLLKKLDIPCTIHWVEGMPHVEFTNFDDAVLFKIARPPSKKTFQI
jgi:hypothetical protein